VKRPVAALAAVGIALASAAAAQPAPVPAIKAIVDPIANAVVAGGHCTGLAIGVDQAGVMSEQFYGTSDTKRPFDGKTEFEIDSVTKTFTALVLALAVGRQKAPMSLQDPLQKYAPKGVTLPTFGGMPIRLVDLATHTSGLPRKDAASTNQSAAQVWGYASKLTPMTAPGTKFLYSNLAFALLGLAEESDQKLTLAQIFQRQITGPLGMTDTAIDLTKEQLARKAQGHHANGTKAANDDYSANKSALEAAGGLNSTLDDMMKFLAFQMGGGKGALMTAALLTQAPVHPRGATGQIGLAWNTNLLKDGTPMINKDGTGPGFTAYVAFTPSSHMGIVVLANQLSCTVSSVAFAVLSVLNRGAANDEPGFGPDDADEGGSP
jgi:D-alanyl-D-alanine-carboxypeptidase/D-alanyl-D-alanine-endopeptidase